MHLNVHKQLDMGILTKNAAFESSPVHLETGSQTMKRSIAK